MLSFCCCYALFPCDFCECLSPLPFSPPPYPGALTNGKKVVLGTKPIVLRQFVSGDAHHVFACSNHPTIIHWNNHKLLFSNVNLKVLLCSVLCSLTPILHSNGALTNIPNVIQEVNYICTRHSDSFRDWLVH